MKKQLSLVITSALILAVISVFLSLSAAAPANPPVNTISANPEPITYGVRLSSDNIAMNQNSPQTVVLTISSQDAREFDVRVAKPGSGLLAVLDDRAELPEGLIARISQTKVKVDANSQQNLQIVLSADSRLTAGTHQLDIWVIDAAGHHATSTSASVSIP